MTKDDVEFSDLIRKFTNKVNDYATLPIGAFVEQVMLSYSVLRDQIVSYKAEAVVSLLPDQQGPTYLFEWGETQEQALNNLMGRFSERWPRKLFPSATKTLRELLELKTSHDSPGDIISIEMMMPGTKRCWCYLHIFGGGMVSGSGDTLDEAVWVARLNYYNKYNIDTGYKSKSIVCYNNVNGLPYWLVLEPNIHKYRWSRREELAFEFPEEDFVWWEDNPEEFISLLPMIPIVGAPRGKVEWRHKSSY